MSYLLDVNSLIAWHHAGSPHHERFHAWARTIGRRRLRTCAMCELGFIRVSMQAFGYTLQQATTELAQIRKETGGFVEHAPSPKLPGWAATPTKTSDAYLVQVAASQGLRLATFDSSIHDPAAELIP